MAACSPVRVVADSRLRLPLSARVVARRRADADLAADHRDRRDRGAPRRLARCRRRGHRGRRRCRRPARSRRRCGELAERGHHPGPAEGGGEMAASFLAARSGRSARLVPRAAGHRRRRAGPPPERSAITRIVDAPAFALRRLAGHRARRSGRLYSPSTEDTMFTGIITDLGRVALDSAPTATPGSRSPPASITTACRSAPRSPAPASA